jgi:hypothetical protein
LGQKSGLEGLESVKCWGRKKKQNRFSSQCSQRKSQTRIFINESTVEIGETKKRLQLLYRSGDWPQGNGVELLGVHLDTISANDETQVLYLGLVKKTLLSVCAEVSLSEAIQYHRHMPIVLFLTLRKYKNVIQINNTNNIKKVMKNILNEDLPSGRRIRQAI